MASDDFNKSSRMGWQMYGAVTGFTTSIGMAVFGLAMYTKPDASGWWLAMGIMGVLGTVGSVINFCNLVKQDINAHKTPPEKKHDDVPPPGPQP